MLTPPPPPTAAELRRDTRRVATLLAVVMAPWLTGLTVLAVYAYRLVAAHPVAAGLTPLVAAVCGFIAWDHFRNNRAGPRPSAAQASAQLWSSPAQLDRPAPAPAMARPRLAGAGATQPTRVPRRARRCTTCWCPREKHEHYRDGSDCGACGRTRCPAFTSRPTSGLAS